MTPAPEYYSATAIARALSTPDARVNKKFVARTAARENWPARKHGNRFEYQPPAAVLEFLVAKPEPVNAHRGITVKFADLVASDPQVQVVLLRESAVKRFAGYAHLGKEAALQLVCNEFAAEHPLFAISVTSLRRWAERFEKFGLDGLVEQKRGRSGRKAFAKDLPEEVVLQARAEAIEHGIKGRLNIARAYRNLVANPTVEGPARVWLHGANASKSYVPPSVRNAMRTPELATKYIQIGAKAARLDGPYTECRYDDSDVRAITADDMTANCYVWTPWPNENGFILIRPQILAVLNVGTLAWLNFRAIIRPKGQYNKDDVWGLLGDYLDDYGLHVDAAGQVDQIAVLEGGTWQSDVVIGAKSGRSDEERFAGLRALGVKVIHTRSPRGKVIETAFNTLQHAADNVRGFCGRMEMKDCPEAVKAQLALVRAGKAHPRQFFLSLAEYCEHLAGVMQALNNERSDGKILQGRAPSEAWAEINPQFQQFPDEAKWRYRAAYRVCEVTRNGVRILVGSGKYQSAYSYSHPALEAHRGRRVVVFWNDTNPDTAAVVYTLAAGKAHTMICVAPRLATPSRFGATEAELAAEATRKKLAQQMCVSHSKTLAPYLQRRAALVAPESVASEAPGRAIAAAREAQEQKERRSAHEQRAVSRVIAQAEDITELSPETPRITSPTESGFAVSLEELQEL